MRKEENGNSKGYNLGYISDARAFLFGIATILIILFHSMITLEPLYPAADKNILLASILAIADFVMGKGRLGVEIFLFLSPIGLYFHMSKDNRIIPFYKRRVSRIIPSVLLVGVIWFAYYETMSFSDYLQSVTGISFFTQGDRTIWFFILIIFMYLIYPFLYYLQDRFGVWIYVILIAIVLVANFIFSIAFTKEFSYIEIALRRIPVFLLGCLFSGWVKERRCLKLWQIILAAVILVGCIILISTEKVVYWDRFNRYIYAPLAVTLCIYLSWLYRSIPKWFTRFVEWLGSYSMEFYLLYEKIIILCLPIFKCHDNFYLTFTCGAVVITFICAIGLKRLVNPGQK